jgi:hypothetical protein
MMRRIWARGIRWLTFARLIYPGFGLNSVRARHEQGSRFGYASCWLPFKLIKSSLPIRYKEP